MTRIQAFFAFLLLPAPALAGGDFKVIVNASVAEARLTARQVSAFLLKDITKWSDGRKVLPVDATSGSPLRADFSRRVHGRSATAIKNYWLQQIFSGRDVPPPEKANEDEIVEYVRANPGAIGYVSTSRSSEGVKVLEVEP